MFSKFKVKKKLISIALALALAAQPLASFPMNVFAGTGKNGVQTAPRIQKKTVTVPVPTTFTVPLTGTFIHHVVHNNINDTFMVDSVDDLTAPFSVTIPVKLGDTVISSPGNVTVLFGGTTLGPATVDATVTVTGITIATGTVTFTGTNTFTGTFTDTVTFTGTNTFTGTGTVTFTGDLRFTGDLMVPVDVTAKVTDDSIDIEAKAASQQPAELTA